MFLPELRSTEPTLGFDLEHGFRQIRAPYPAGFQPIQRFCDPGRIVIARQDPEHLRSKRDAATRRMPVHIPNG